MVVEFFNTLHKHKRRHLHYFELRHVCEQQHNARHAVGSVALWLLLISLQNCPGWYPYHILVGWLVFWCVSLLLVGCGSQLTELTFVVVSTALF